MVAKAAAPLKQTGILDDPGDVVFEMQGVPPNQPSVSSHLPDLAQKSAQPGYLTHHPGRWTRELPISTTDPSERRRPASWPGSQQKLRDAMERNPVEFLVHRLQPQLDAVRTQLSGFLGADPEGLVFVDNATTASRP